MKPLQIQNHIRKIDTTKLKSLQNYQNFSGNGNVIKIMSQLKNQNKLELLKISKNMGKLWASQINQQKLISIEEPKSSFQTMEQNVDTVQMLRSGTQRISVSDSIFNDVDLSFEQ
ncbi:Hypothetical_protein [Hexamita inflata]|uniref:Hypothetical_protein n=1 Tax=Hexamita inflata TaxID=28002 RepID=A0AA86QVP4_9EUKA|nr:Hypothetical protein HINF_LOCUS50051 [Hexamita inflata]